MQLSTKVAGAKKHTPHSLALLRASQIEGFRAAVTGGRLKGIKASGEEKENPRALCVFASGVERWHLKPQAITSIFLRAVGTRRLTKQAEWLKRLVVQCNPYLQSAVMY